MCKTLIVTAACLISTAAFAAPMNGMSNDKTSVSSDESGLRAEHWRGGGYYGRGGYGRGYYGRGYYGRGYGYPYGYGYGAPGVCVGTPVIDFCAP